MSDALGPLPPELSDLVSAERFRPGAPAEASKRVSSRLLASMTRSVATSGAQRLRRAFLALRRPVWLASSGAAGLFTFLVALGIWNVRQHLAPAVASDVLSPVVQLGDRPDTHVYGLGPGADRRCDGRCAFRFTLTPTASAREVVDLRYSAEDVGPADVVIALNGVPVGSVPATFADFMQENTLRLKTKYLRKNAENLVVFDGLRDPTAGRRWTITGVRIGVEHVFCKHDCIDAAKAFFTVCNNRFDAPEATPERFMAWNDCRKAKTQLDALDDGDHLDLYREVTAKIKEIERKMDASCGQVLLDSKKQVEVSGEPKRRLPPLKKGLSYFPADSPCYSRLKDEIGRLE